jgi:hypothetical protein
LKDNLLLTHEFGGSPVKLGYKVLFVDLLALVALYFVLQDLSWRTYYAMTPHAAVSGYTPSFSYSIFTRYFTMAGSGVSLTSPPTLDWVQILAVGLLLVNGWFLYVILTERRKSTPATGPTDSPASPPAPG